MGMSHSGKIVLRDGEINSVLPQGIEIFDADYNRHNLHAILKRSC